MSLPGSISTTTQIHTDTPSPSLLLHAPCFPLFASLATVIKPRSHELKHASERKTEMADPSGRPDSEEIALSELEAALEWILNPRVSQDLRWW